MIKLKIIASTLILACALDSRADIHFEEVTEQAGILSAATWKYGGPSLADLNGDGRMDLVLVNHHDYPAQIFLSDGKGTWTEVDPVKSGDVHGIAAGDYDKDGLIDLAVSMGGGNGTNPQPPRLLRNTGEGFADMTVAAGISQMGARGRSVRWIDPDLDGDLDLLQINARQLPGEDGPRNILFENQGDGTFIYRPSPAFEPVEAERVLVTDLNGDRVADLVTFTPLGIWIGSGDFQYANVTAQWLADLSEQQLEHVSAVAEADIDNDGDMDLYVARGKTYYEIANNSVDFDPSTGRLDLRDEGNEGQDGISFEAGETIELKDFWHWHRGVNLDMDVYAGVRKNRMATPEAPILVTAAVARGMPEEMEENGWYLGYLGDGQWRLAWNLNGDLAWGLRASVTGVTSVTPDWEPQQRGVPDLLLMNQGDHFKDASAALPEVSGDNNWGVITGDFDNDTRSDFFIYRFGKLNGRVPDAMLLNQASNGDLKFSVSIDHGANNVEAGGHGDMGSPFDLDQDGWLDILSGSDNPGYWHLYRNVSGESSDSPNQFVTILVGQSPNGTDPHGAEIELSTMNGKQFRRVGSAGAVHSQSLNNQVHFGLGENPQQVSVTVRWRDGTKQPRENLEAGKSHAFGE